MLRRILSCLFKKNTDVVTSIFTKDHFSKKNYSIGAYTYGKPTVLFDNDQATLQIGKFCSIAQGVTIFLGGNHRIDWVTTYPFNDLLEYFPEAENIKGHPASKGSVIIGNDVWIGKGVTILSGVTVSDGAVLAANSVVTKDVGPYEVWAGNPSRLIKKRFSDEAIEVLLEKKWWAWDIELIRQKIPYLCTEFENHHESKL